MSKKELKLLLDLIIVWISVTALLCAALNLHISRNMLGCGRS